MHFVYYSRRDDDIMTTESSIKFSRHELFTFYKAKTITYSGSALSWTDLLEMNDEELLEKFDQLTDEEQNNLEIALDQCVEKYKDRFDELPENVNTEEKFEEHQSILEEIADNIVEDLEYFASNEE